MKKILLLVIIIIAFYDIQLAQPCKYTEGKKQQIIDSLFAWSWDERDKSLEIIVYCKITEAKEVLEQRFWEYYMPTSALDALYELGSDMCQRPEVFPVILN